MGKRKRTIETTRNDIDQENNEGNQNEIPENILCIGPVCLKAQTHTRTHTYTNTRAHTKRLKRSEGRLKGTEGKTDRGEEEQAAGGATAVFAVCRTRQCP